MSFKLIVQFKKVDHKIKIDLQPGERIFGRNSLFDCLDKRISRKHGLLTVNKDSLVLKAIHQNPCFYKKSGSTEINTLNLNDSITLFGGDKFALLIDSTWFEVLYIPCEDTDEDTRETEEEDHDINLNETENDSGEAENDDKLDSSGTTLDCENSNDQATNNNQNEPSTPKNTSSANNTNIVIDKIPENTNESPEVSEQNQNNLNPKLKRSNSANGNDENKKIKLEPEVKQEQDVTPGSSNQAGASNVDNAVAPPPGPPRERCMYGASCYRKNPQHHAQYSHPRDPDWGPGERGVCPYGASCSKTDPRHWRDHEHPPGKLPPQRPGKQKARKQDSSSPPIPSKRIRKTVPKGPQVVLSDSEPDEDPYATDESDEWQPGDTSQDFSEDYY